MILPIGWNHAGRARYGLTEGVMKWRRQLRAVGVGIRGEIPKPILPRFEASNDHVIRFTGVLRRVLTRRRVTTADVAALRTSA